MPYSLAGVALAAGAGSRLRPLTYCRPKPLCPVGNVPLVDHALARLAGAAERVAVNVHHGRDSLQRHLAGRTHLSVELPRPLGTAGALGQLRPWLDGAAVLVVNADTWCPGDLVDFVAGWDGERVRILVPGGVPFGPRAPVAAALMPWSDVSRLEAEPSGLYEVVWRRAHDAGRLEPVAHHGPFVDCGTPADYLRANLLASGDRSVVSPDASIRGTVEQSVVWGGASVVAGERLVRAIRTPRFTVAVRGSGRRGSSSGG